MTTPTTPPSDPQPQDETTQRISNFVHVHQKCYKCGGCIHECDHRVKTTLTTTGGATEYYDALGNHIGTKAPSERSIPKGESKHKTPSEPNNTDVAIDELMTQLETILEIDVHWSYEVRQKALKAKAAIKALLVEAQQNTEHYWIKYYGDQRNYLDGSDGDMPAINELKRHQQLHKDRLAALRKETPQ